jgi:hypothetical protein
MLAYFHELVSDHSVSYRIDLFVYIVEEKIVYSKVLIILRKKTNFILKLLRL